MEIFARALRYVRSMHVCRKFSAAIALMAEEGDMLGINVSSLLLLHYHSLHAVRIVKAVRRAIASRNTRDAEHSTLLRVRHMDDDEQLLVARVAIAA